MNEKILVVDDEKEIADLLEVYLKNDNYTVYKYYSGIEALKCIEETEIDLAILDIMLPDIDGFRICQKIREKFYFPVIMLTAKIEDGDKIMGLTIGADDYITKPFNPLEVVARVKTQLRRYQKYNNPVQNQPFQKSEYDIRGLIINKDMNDSSGESLIQIKNLTAAVKLNNGDTLVTVNNASIELKRGNSYAIVGKSGSGKTSLISIIGLLNRSYKGEYLYDGVSVSALTDRELSMLRANNIGFVFQN